MNQVTYALPRPGKALWGVLITVATLAILAALSEKTVGVLLFRWLSCNVNDVMHGQVWRLVTSGVLTPPGDIVALLFQLLALYLFGTTVERRWGERRLLQFLVIAVVAGNLFAMLVGWIAGLAGATGLLLRPRDMFGPDAMVTALLVAWARENPEGVVRLYFVIPVKAKYFVWFTVGTCVFLLVRGQPTTESVAALFGGVLVGLALAGSPSFARRQWLKLRLALLKRKSSALEAQELLESVTKRAPRRPRPPGAPPLRVLPGGLEDVLRKRKPPKDKRYLN
jgi:membrane associated rhomboid family serine protease